MNKITGFRDIKRQSLSYRDVDTRLADYQEIISKKDAETVIAQAARCTNCGVPFCHSEMTYQPKTSGCPLHNLIPEWNELVYYNRFDAALERLLLTNPFPEFTSRVCPAPCESACTNGLHGEAVAIKTLEYHIQEYGFEHHLIQPSKLNLTGYSVAIIGSGPAGLSAAHYLSGHGHAVHVFEKDKEPGGLLMYGIPTMKLDKDIVRRRITILKKQGVVFHTNTEIGIDIPFSEITDTYDKTIITVGTQRARDIAVEGRSLSNIVMALDYLKDSIVHKEDASVTATNKNVVIIGGGDTATDCVATALRQQAASITQLEITPQKPKERHNKNPWPQWKDIHKVDYGQEEYIKQFQQDPRIFNTTVTKFIGDSVVEAVETAKVDWKNGSVHVTDDRTVLPADLVIIAIGFIGLDQNADSWLTSNSKNGYSNPYQRTSDIYISGDARTGQSLVVQAIEEGKQVAISVHNDLVE